MEGMDEANLKDIAPAIGDLLGCMAKIERNYGFIVATEALFRVYMEMLSSGVKHRKTNLLELSLREISLILDAMARDEKLDKSYLPDKDIV